MKPIVRAHDLYKGADFLMQFRFKHDGAYIDLTGSVVKFRAYDPANDSSPLFEFSSDVVSPNITIDTGDNNLVTVLIGLVDTTDLTQKSLWYEVDLVDAGDITKRWMVGEIAVHGVLNG